MTPLRAIARMTTIRSTDLPAERALSAVALVFLVNGIAYATWVSRLPAIADRHDLSEGVIGTALMALALGAIVAFSIAGSRIERHGSAPTILLFATPMLAMLPLMGLAPSLWLLLPVMLLYGAGNGGMDVAMNAQGVEVEAAMGRSVINTLHGFFSLGGAIGAAIGGLAAWYRVAPTVHLPVMGVGLLAVLWWLRPHLLPDPPREGTVQPVTHQPVFALPPRALWTIGAIALFAAVGEGAMADWSALYLNDHLDTGGGVAALGFAAFSVTMLVGRFSGDALVDRLGAAVMVRTGAVVASVGLSAGLVIDTPVAMIVAFALVGLGAAVLFPLVFKAAAVFPGVSRGRAVAGVATIGYTGFLTGPPLLGWLAEPTSLRVSLALVAVLIGAIAVIASAIRPRDDTTNVG